MGTIGIGSAVLPMAGGRVRPRQRRPIDSGAAPEPGGGDIRWMRTVGVYSTVGLRIMPPIGSEPAPEEFDSDAEFEANAQFEDNAQFDADGEFETNEQELLAERELAVAAGSRAK